MTGCFVTGTDTGVGKTFASAALLRALQAHHGRVVGMKPVSAGGDEDVLALRAASTVQVPADLDNPIALREPLSPHIAAAHEGVRIVVADLAHRCRKLQERADFVVVEGAGGFHVPLTDSATGADLAQALALPVVLVVGLRLGCLNHALLTAEAIRSRGLELAGWIANRIDPAMLAPGENVATLRARLDAPLLADIARQATPNARDVAIDLPPRWRTSR